MELIRRDWRDGYIYDPIIKGYDTSFWKSVTGTPAMNGNNIRLNVARMSSFLLHEVADVEFSINVPVKPTSGDVRQWGLRAPSTSNVGAAYFDITDTVFSAKTIDGNGNTLSTTLVWTDGTFSGHQIVFRITCEADLVRYRVNGVIVATHSVALTSAFGPVPHLALPIDVNNGNADNMDVAYIAVRKAAGIV